MSYESEKFCKATTHFAAKAHLDPHAIKTAYQGREELLIERENQKDNDKFVGTLASGGFLIAGAITQFTVIAEYNSYRSYETFNPVDNVEMASPFLLLFAAVAAWKFTRAAKANRDVKRDMEKFSPQKQLPKPGNLI